MTRRSASRRTACPSLVAPAQCLLGQLARSDRVVHGAGPAVAPQSVFALQKELARETERRYTKLSFSERLKLQLENLKSGAKA